MNSGFSIPIGECIVDNKKEKAVLQLTDQNPHGILSGSTGSGKSELIITILTSIAMNYSPEEINFCIIDFKAGSTSDLVVDFPHCAGVSSDLEETDAVIRAISLLKAEGARRQAFLANAVKKGIISKAEADEYRLAREKDPTLPPLPLLLIVVDEYGQLKKQYDRFDAELATIAKQGRSRFMYLLLADNESNTFHGLSSNISYRICLGFPDISDVSTVLNTSLDKDSLVFRRYATPGKDGKIPRGRGILHADGRLIAFQSPYVRAPSPHYKSQLDIFISAAKRKYEAVGNVACCVLPDRLPAKYYGNAEKFLSGFDPKTGNYPSAVDWNIPIGIYDDIDHNQMPFYYINPILENCVFLGNKGCGKTSALKTILFNVANKASPKTCNLLILNFGNSFAYDEYRNVPHVCDVLDLGIGAKKTDVEKLERSVTVLKGIIEKQTGLLTGERTEYLIFIDGYKFFAEHYQRIEFQMRDIITEGKTAGISFIVTCNRFRHISESVRLALQTRVLLRCADDEFGFVFSGNCEKKPSSLGTGQGILEDEDGRCFTVQVAFPACVPPEQYLAAVDDFVRSYYAKNSLRANALPFMPDILSLKQLRAARPFMRSAVYFGMETEHLRPVGKSVQDIDCIFIEGTAQSGKTFLIRSLTRQLQRYDNTVDLLIIDNEQQEHFLPENDSVRYISPADTFEFLSAIAAYPLRQNKETVVVVDDLHLLYNRIKTQNKSVYDVFLQWLRMQRERNPHIHFILSSAAEANAYEFLMGFQKNEVVLLGNKIMTSRYAAPDCLKSSAFNTTLPPHYGWVCFAETAFATKIINSND